MELSLLDSRYHPKKDISGDEALAVGHHCNQFFNNFISDVFAVGLEIANFQLPNGIELELYFGCISCFDSLTSG